MSRTGISFFAGASEWVIPEAVVAAGLGCRLAIVQETYRPDSVDMYFDRELWAAVIAFAVDFTPEGEVSVVDRAFGEQRKAPNERDERPLSAHLATQQASEETGPAEFLMVRKDGQLVLCVATEFWTQIGGPQPYHDSYTYSVFSREDISERVMRFLSGAEASSGWSLSDSIGSVPFARPRRWWEFWKR